MTGSRDLQRPSRDEHLHVHPSGAPGHLTRIPRATLPPRKILRGSGIGTRTGLRPPLI
jgi:hypothetical protein